VRRVLQVLAILIANNGRQIHAQLAHGTAFFDGLISKVFNMGDVAKRIETGGLSDSLKGLGQGFI
jgi:hypothetical protein